MLFNILVLFLSHGPLTSTRKEVKYKFVIIIYILLYFRAGLILECDTPKQQIPSFSPQ